MKNTILFEINASFVSIENLRGIIKVLEKMCELTNTLEEQRGFNMLMAEAANKLIDEIKKQQNQRNWWKTW